MKGCPYETSARRWLFRYNYQNYHNQKDKFFFMTYQPTIHSAAEIETHLQRLLPRVAKPGRYTGGEYNQVREAIYC